jgi:RNA polymerase sigma-70 factor, ECF subfamily
MTGEQVQSDDKALMTRIAHADVHAFEMLYDRYSGLVYSLACGMLQDAQVAQDVTQDVFLAIWRGAEVFDVRRGSLRSWILSLAHHKSVDTVRRLRRHAMSPLPYAMTVDADVVTHAIQSAESADVRAALGALSHDQRAAIVLAYYGGYTQREIADRLGAPLGTIKTRIRDGLLRLRAVLGMDIAEKAP